LNAELVLLFVIGYFVEAANEKSLAGTCAKMLRTNLPGKRLMVKYKLSSRLFNKEVV
jgi:hypothetical protein